MTRWQDVDKNMLTTDIMICQSINHPLMITWQPIKVLYHRPEPEQSMATRWGCGLSLYWLHCPVYHTLILLSTLITTYFHSFSSSSFHHFTIFNISSTPSFWIRHSQKLLLGFVAPQFRAVAEILGICPESFSSGQPASKMILCSPKWKQWTENGAQELCGF